MDAVTVTFLAIGGFALLLLILSLLGGHLHLGHVHLGHLHLGHLHGGQVGGPGGGFELTLPAIAGFLGAFGFSGAIVATLVGGGALAAVLAVVVGLVVAVPAAWLAGRLLTAALNMATDATLTSADLIGATGVVVTPVPAGGYGEVRLAVAGQQIKFNARADGPLPRGTRIFVIEVPSPTSVLVEPTPGVLRKGP
ncbi:MAG TPA: NfeD family protein [Rugosimonospora sp.]|nr:NfeD family protein [Rugosimonospora sp.]